MDIPEDILRALENDPSNEQIRAIAVDADALIGVLLIANFFKSIDQLTFQLEVLEKISLTMHKRPDLAENIMFSLPELDKHVVSIFDITINALSNIILPTPPKIDDAEHERLREKDRQENAEIVLSLLARRDAFKARVGLS